MMAIYIAIAKAVSRDSKNLLLALPSFVFSKINSYPYSFLGCKGLSAGPRSLGTMKCII